MEWFVLVLMLSLSSSIQTESSPKCPNCVRQTDSGASFRHLTCILECEETLRRPEESTTGRPANILQISTGFSQQDRTLQQANPKPPRMLYHPVNDKTPNHVRNRVAFPMLDHPDRPTAWEDAERQFPEMSEEDEDGATENALDAALNEVNLHGDAFHRVGPKSKRNNDAGKGRREHETLQKRYGGFMRRIRPKMSNLKWDHQKGGRAFRTRLV